jgi:hypothetical protein
MGKRLELINEKAKKKKGSKYKNSGEIMVTKFECLPKFEFVEYVQGELEINMMIGIDYTASNGFIYFFFIIFLFFFIIFLFVFF